MNNRIIFIPVKISDFKTLDDLNFEKLYTFPLQILSDEVSYDEFKSKFDYHLLAHLLTKISKIEIMRVGNSHEEAVKIVNEHSHYYFSIIVEVKINNQFMHQHAFSEKDLDSAIINASTKARSILLQNTEINASDILSVTPLNHGDYRNSRKFMGKDITLLWPEGLTAIKQFEPPLQLIGAAKEGLSFFTSLMKIKNNLSEEYKKKIRKEREENIQCLRSKSFDQHLIEGADELDSENETLVDIFLKHIFSWKNTSADYESNAAMRRYFYGMGANLYHLRHTKGFQALPEITRFTLTHMFDGYLLNFASNENENAQSEWYEKTIAVYRNQGATKAAEIYDPYEKTFKIHFLQKILFAELENKLYSDQDFVVSFNDHFGGRDKIGVKMGSLFVAYRPLGKNSCNAKVYKINFAEKCNNLQFDFSRERYSSSGIPFESLIPFSKNSFYNNATLCGGFSFANASAAKASLEEAWEIRNQLIAQAMSSSDLVVTHAIKPLTLKQS